MLLQLYTDDYAIMARVTTYSSWCNDYKSHAHMARELW